MKATTFRTFPGVIFAAETHAELGVVSQRADEQAHLVRVPMLEHFRLLEQMRGSRRQVGPHALLRHGTETSVRPPLDDTCVDGGKRENDAEDRCGQLTRSKTGVLYVLVVYRLQVAPHCGENRQRHRSEDLHRECLRPALVQRQSALQHTSLISHHSDIPFVVCRGRHLHQRVVRRSWDLHTAAPRPSDANQRQNSGAQKRGMKPKYTKLDTQR